MTSSGQVSAGQVSRAYALALDAVGPMPAPDFAEFDSVPTRERRRRSDNVRKAGVRRGWWYPPLVMSLILAGLLTIIQWDQRLSELLIWPTQGAQFAEVNSQSSADQEYLPNMVIVIGGFNRRDGTSIAQSLLPSLQDDQTRVFSLVYGSGIYEGDIASKFDELYAQYRPERVDFFGSSMGGDVALRLAAHISSNYPNRQEVAELEAEAAASDSDSDSDSDSVGAAGLDAGAGAPDAEASVGDVDGDADADADPALVPLEVGNIYLDCTPLSAADLRSGRRGEAEFLRGLTEALQTDGGGGVRLLAEMLAKKDQWSSGNFPYLQIDGDEFWYKYDEIRREKVNVRGVSTVLIKDQYAVIRQFDADLVLAQLDEPTRILYFLPADRSQDFTVDVGRVEAELTAYAQQLDLPIEIAAIEGGFHASATRNEAQYNEQILAFEEAGPADS